MRTTFSNHLEVAAETSQVRAAFRRLLLLFTATEGSFAIMSLRSAVEPDRSGCAVQPDSGCTGLSAGTITPTASGFPECH